MSEEIKDMIETIPNGEFTYRNDGSRSCGKYYAQNLLDEKDKQMKDLQQKVKQLENIRKEAIEFMKENCDIITIDKGWIIRSELTTTGLGKLFKILNKGE